MQKSEIINLLLTKKLRQFQCNNENNFENFVMHKFKTHQTKSLIEKKPNKCIKNCCYFTVNLFAKHNTVEKF